MAKKKTNKRKSKAPAKSRKTDGKDGGGAKAKSDQRSAKVEAAAVVAKAAPRPCPIVGIGASAGGLDAFKRFFNAMPADAGMAFVLVQHLDPTHESLMADLLAKHTEMKVVQVTDRMAIEPNCVFMIPPNANLAILKGELHLSEPVERRGLRLPIDHFFRSLAEDQQERAVCIILSGTGTDGTLGLKAVKENGGTVLVQQPDSAQHAGMPNSAIDTGLVDFVLPIEEMPVTLTQFARYFFTSRTAKPVADNEPETDEVSSIVTLLSDRTDYDFRCYKPATLLRRIERRMGLTQIDSMADYEQCLRDRPDELEALFKDLLIGVTRFFRDREAFETLAKDAIHPLIEGHDDKSPLRVWVPGCATGEEAYSLAMLFIEQLSAAKKHGDVQIFATDVDQDSLQFARLGRYPENIAADVSQERLRRFFARDGDHYCIGRQLRESVVFAVQSIVSDPPFSKLDLISCRNLMIYLVGDVQEKLIELFHFALNDDGYLFLGTSESAGQRAQMFDAISAKWRIYQRVGTSRVKPADFPIVSNKNRPWNAATSAPEKVSSTGRLAELTRQFLLDEYKAAAVVINRQCEILYLYGSTTEYLDLPEGELTNNILAMAREGLRGRLRTAVAQAIRDGQRVQIRGARVKRGGHYHGVRFAVLPLPGEKSREILWLVIFEEEPEPAVSTDTAVARADTILVQQLETELKATREDLQSHIEELQTANEEVTSMNQELQSTNEELETSSEELQSLNEELNTGNNQLQEKVAELEATNNDMVNLFNSTDVATLFLDRDFRLKRFTPAATALFKLIASDIGRPIDDIARKFTDDDFLSDARSVLKKLTPIEKEVVGDSRGSLREPNDSIAERSTTFIRRILPYRTLDDRIDGVIVTFLDITERKRIEEKIRELNKDLERRVAQRTQQIKELAEATENLGEGVVITENNLDWPGPKIIFANEAMCGITGYSRDEMVGQTPRIFQGEKTDRDVVKQLRRDLDAGRRANCELINYRKDGSPFHVELTISPVHDDEGNVTKFVSIHHDITEQLQAQRAVVESGHRLRAIFDAAVNAIITIDQQGLITDVNAATEDMFGYTKDELVGQNVKILMPSPYAEEHDGYISRYLETREARIIGIGREVTGKRKDGSTFPIDLSVSEVKHMGLFTGIIRDITEQKEAEEKLRREHQLSEGIINTAQNIVLVLDTEGRIIRFNPFVEELTGWRLDEVQGHDWFETFLPEHERERVRNLFGQAISGERTRGNIDTIVTKDGREREIVWYDAPLTDADGNLLGLLCTGQDVTERRMLEREILEISADEQRRIGQELHDGTQQQLTGLELLARNMAKSIEDVDDLSHTMINDLNQKSWDIAKGLEEAARHVNLLSRGLIPVEVDAEGLRSALSDMVNRLNLLEQATFTFTCKTPVEVANNFTATHLYRIAQEAVNNAIKHSQAEQIEISLTDREGTITLNVSDNGVGLPDKREDGFGMGLRIMAYRANLIGATLDVGTANGSGTKVVCTVSH